MSGPRPEAGAWYTLWQVPVAVLIAVFTAAWYLDLLALILAFSGGANLMTWIEVTFPKANA